MGVGGERGNIMDESQAAEYTAYPKRWLVLGVFSLCLMVNSACWITYSQITHEASLYYEVSTTWIDILSMLFMFWYLPVNFPACWVLEKYGLRTGVLFGSGLGFIGAGLRIVGMSKATFPAVVIGQSLVAIGQPFLLNAPAKVSAMWFPDDERALATVIGSSAQLIGSALGFVVPPIFVESIDSSNTDATPSDADGVLIVNVIFACIAFAACVLSYVVVTAAPLTPPSASTGNESQAATYATTLKIAFKNGYFMLLCLSFGLALGAFNTLATVMNQILTPYGYDNTETSICSAVSIVAGFIGSGVTGVIIDKTHWYKSVLLLWMGIGSTALFAFYLCLGNDRLVLLCLCSGCFGLFIMPVIPLSMELGAEMLYPLDEALPVGLLVSSGQVFGIAFISFFQYLLDEKEYKLTVFIISMVLYVACGLAALVGGCRAPDYKRLIYEQEQVVQRDEIEQSKEVQPLLPPKTV
eukprot:TRINITY_DN8560_c0_g1_i1.p1 TRINITY_DN8560_c0_g1~~TRINITY_DN8560_c0_g1_i1.p1  ORF type:complete len:468 (+),score=45.93 TRINITY_DN8560_c0_g1_i1:28-1431(+)